MSAHEYNVACKESVAQHINAICEILEKIEATPDEDFSVMPWRLLGSSIRIVDRYFARLNERVARIRDRSFEKTAAALDIKPADK